MIFFDILYNIIIYPIEFIIEIVFYLFNNVFKSGYATSIFFLSLTINFISLPLYNIAESWQKKERDIQNKMKPMIDNIKAVYKGDKRYLLIRACQRINGYKTIYAFRGTLGLLIQIPFFLAAYNFIHNLSNLQLGSFLFIKDFSQPDEILNIGNVSINILPFIMTLFSLSAGFVYSKNLKFKESLPLYIVSLIFLVLLYNSPSGLVFYWTLNCLFSLIKNIVIEYKLYKIFVENKHKILKGYNIFFIILTVIFLLLLSLGNIEQKGYLGDFNLNERKEHKEENRVYHFRLLFYSKIFRNSDIFGIKANTNKLNNNAIVDIKFDEDDGPFGNITLNDNIENIKTIEVYYSLSIKKYIVNIFMILLILLILFNMHIFNNIFVESFKEKRNLLIIISCLVISVLSGIFIPSSLIGNSPTEFKNPFDLILNDFSMSLGLFLFYPMFLYILFSDRIKNYLTLIFIFLSSFVLANTFVMKGNYININSDFIFDDTNLLKASFNEILLTIFLIIILVSIILFIIKKKKLMFIINIYSIVLLALIGVSVFDVSKIIKEHNKLSEIQTQIKDNYLPSNKIFNISKTGENIFVFILDRAINSYWIDAFERFPEYKKDFEGFIIYPNTVSFAGNTTTIASLYGGYDYLPYEMSINGNYNITNFHNEALLTIPLALEKYNYKTYMFEPVYANFYSSIPDLTIFTNYTNISAYNNDSIYKNSTNKYLTSKHNSINIMNIKKIIRFSIFRMLPINLRYDFYSDKDWFDANDYKYINSSIYYYAILNSTKDFINITNYGNYCNIIYNEITHEPNYFSSDFLPHFTLNEVDKKDLSIYKDDHSARTFYANVSSINILTDFFKFLKENNVYDNTKIIIVSDHGWKYVNTTLFKGKKIDFINAYNALLIYKDFNAKGEVKIETNFMTIADTPYLATKHIPNIKNPFNNKPITNYYKTNTMHLIRLKHWAPYKQFPNRYNFDYFYSVKDNIFDINNWKKFQIDWKTKETKEIEIENEM